MTPLNGHVSTVLGNSFSGSSSATSTSSGSTLPGASSKSHASSASSLLTTSASTLPSLSRAAGVKGSSSSSSSSPSSAPSASDQSSSAKIGHGVGVPLGLLICAVLGFLGFRYKEQLKRCFKAQTSDLAPGIDPDPCEDSRSQLDMQSTPEMEGAYRPSEMDAWGDGHLNGGVPRRQEMAGTGTPGEMWTPSNTHELPTLRESRQREARRKSRREPTGELG